MQMNFYLELMTIKIYPDSILLGSAYFMHFLHFTGHLELRPLFSIRYKLELKIIFLVPTQERLLLVKSIES